MMHDDDNDDDEFGLYDGICQACDMLGPVDDMSLCEDCAGKLERDMIRRRDWDYSALVFGVPEDQLEALRQAVIEEYGEALELLAPSGEESGKRRRR